MEFGSSAPSFIRPAVSQPQQEEEQHRRTPSPLHPSSSFFSRRSSSSSNNNNNNNNMHKKQLHDEEDRRQEAGSTSSSGTSSSEDEQRRGAEERNTSFSVRRASSAFGLTATAPPFVLPQSPSLQQHMAGPGKGGEGRARRSGLGNGHVVRPQMARKGRKEEREGYILLIDSATHTPKHFELTGDSDLRQLVESAVRNRDVNLLIAHAKVCLLILPPSLLPSLLPSLFPSLPPFKQPAFCTSS